MNSDWVMVIITGIYVVATCFICWANFKSANASKEQLQEMKRQYAEANRPHVEVEVHYLRRTWYIIRFVNHGEKTAQHVKINIEQRFIDSLPEESFKNELVRLQGNECVIGVGQHYDLFVGSNKFRGNPNIQPFSGTIEYESQGNTYQSDIFVDLEHYMTFFSATTDDEDQLNSIKKISKELTEIRRALNRLEERVGNSNCGDKEN